ncbi:thioredoxin reductase [Halobacteriales archaeon QS_3_64_16]|nr:MAG: thioredoxin reductase [Halobacteriales archaeon QS_3_64_16]
MIEGSHDVAIVGGGVAGLSAGIFTARAGLDTLVVDDAERGSILRRNAHLENFPGFPAGVDTRLLLEMTKEQAERAGCTFLHGVVTGLREAEAETETGGFELALEGGETIDAERVIAASWADSSYLDGLGLEIDRRGSKGFVVEKDDDGPQAGHTGIEGLYAAGRIADQYHQAIVTAGHGARVGLTLVHDADVSLYHDWVAPAGYFTDRGREVPPGIEEIDEAERRQRERESMEVMREYFAEPHPDEPTPHPSLADDQ